jgi:hypothetical protein
VNNFWKGNEIKHPVNPGHGFQNQFTGTHGNIHYQWIGRMTCKDGTMLNATYFAEYAEGAKFTAGNMFKNPLLDHWPSFSAGWPNVNTTRIKPHSLYVGEKGNVYLAAKGRRVITTSNAHQEMPSPTADKGSRGQWSDFVRVYTPGLTTLRYSSLLHGRWNWDTGKGGSAVNLSVVTPVKGGLAVTGTAPADTDADAATGDPMPTANIPEWGKPKRTATHTAVVLTCWRPREPAKPAPSVSSACLGRWPAGRLRVRPIQPSKPTRARRPESANPLVASRDAVPRLEAGFPRLGGSGVHPRRRAMGRLGGALGYVAARTKAVRAGHLEPVRPQRPTGRHAACASASDPLAADRDRPAGQWRPPFRDGDRPAREARR